MIQHKQLSLAISPCPNDTYIFGSWILGLVSNERIKLSKVEYFDIEELNNKASIGEFDLIKVSAAHAGSLLDRYDILDSGAALGLDCGPLLISKKKLEPKDIKHAHVLLPGEKTTAHFLFNAVVGQAKKKSFVHFSLIEDLLLNDEADAGVIIHENRFTYQTRGLHLVKDLGQEWVHISGQAIPLGLIMIKKSFSIEDKKQVNYLIQQSIQQAQTKPEALRQFIHCHAQEMSQTVQEQHISLYVNPYSISMSEMGRKAVMAITQEIYGPNSISLSDFIY